MYWLVMHILYFRQLKF